MHHEVCTRHDHMKGRPPVRRASLGSRAPSGTMGRVSLLCSAPKKGAPYSDGLTLSSLPASNRCHVQHVHFHQPSIRELLVQSVPTVCVAAQGRTRYRAKKCFSSVDKHVNAWQELRGNAPEVGARRTRCEEDHRIFVAGAPEKAHIRCESAHFPRFCAHDGARAHGLRSAQSPSFDSLPAHACPSSLAQSRRAYVSPSVCTQVRSIVLVVADCLRCVDSAK